MASHKILLKLKIHTIAYTSNTNYKSTSTRVFNTMNLFK